MIGRNICNGNLSPRKTLTAGVLLIAGALATIATLNLAYQGAVPSPYGEFAGTMAGLAAFSGIIAITASLRRRPDAAADTQETAETGAGIQAGPEDLDEGIAIGRTEANKEICVTDEILGRHMLIVGQSGNGRNSPLERIVASRMRETEHGNSRGATVVVAAADALPESLRRRAEAGDNRKVRFINLSHAEEVPALNPLDPTMYADRDASVDSIVRALKSASDAWRPRLEDIVVNNLKAMYEYNAHEDTTRDEMLNVADLIRMVEDGPIFQSGQDEERAERTAFQNRVLPRVESKEVIAWLYRLRGWPNETRAEAVGPLLSLLGPASRNAGFHAAFAQPESALTMREVLRNEQMLIVSAERGQTGRLMTALFCSTIVNSLEQALRGQERLPVTARKRCLLVADELEQMGGVDWEGMLAEISEYGGAVALSTPSIRRFEAGTGRAAADIASNCGSILCYQLGAADAQLMHRELGYDISPATLMSTEPNRCYARVRTASGTIPTFKMRNLPV